MVSPQSDCPSVDKNAGPTLNYCIKTEDNEQKNISFNMKCTWDAAPENISIGQVLILLLDVFIMK
jgi:hypothetical protein